MARYQVTVDDELPQQLFCRDDGLARLVEQVLNQILEARVTEQLKARPYERTEQRQGYRNGHREKPLITRIGRLVLEVLRVRSGEFFHGNVCALPAERAGAGAHPHGDGHQWGVNAKGYWRIPTFIWSEAGKARGSRVCGS